MVELGKRSIGNFLEHRMPTYAEQLSYRGLFGLFPFIILVFALLAVLQLDVVFDRLIEAAMDVPPQEIPEPIEPVAEKGRDQAAFLLRHGCNLAQGYLYGKPVAAGEILARWGGQV